MPTPASPQPIVFVTEDGLLTITLTLGKDPLSPHQEPLVTAAVELFWEGASPPEPIATEIRRNQPGLLAHLSDNGETLDGTLTMDLTPSGRIAIDADLLYGDHDDHHLIGVVAIFTPSGG
jgi:hypothetical protein